MNTSPRTIQYSNLGSRSNILFGITKIHKNLYGLCNIYTSILIYVQQYPMKYYIRIQKHLYSVFAIIRLFLSKT